MDTGILWVSANGVFSSVDYAGNLWVEVLVTHRSKKFFFSFLCLLDAKMTSFNEHVNKRVKIDKRRKLDRNKLGNLSRAGLRGLVNLGFSVFKKKFRTKNWLGSKDFLWLFDRENVGV